jgi:hypothetical protein
LDESDIFELDEEYLELVAEQDKKRPQVVMQELIESLRVIISLGDNINPELMDQSVWNSGLKNYLSELLAKLRSEQLTQKSQ